VVTATDSEQKFDLAVDGVRLSGNATLWRMTGNNLEAANKVGQPPQVEMKQTEMGETSATLSVAPISVGIYRFPVMQTVP
jgi:alpha-N-arabinofuranosidase